MLGDMASCGIMLLATVTILQYAVAFVEADRAARVPDFLVVFVQAMRVTQEQRGSLKLEAYMRLLQELLLIQIQQASITHPNTSWDVISQVRPYTLLPVRVERLAK